MNKPPFAPLARRLDAAFLAGLLALLALTVVSPLQAADLNEVANQGGKLTAADAEALEASLEENPDDAETHAQLLGYYFLHRSAASGSAKAEHVEWLVRNHPGSPLAGSPYAQLFRIDPGFNRVRAAWEEAVSSHPDDARVLGNAGEFFLMPERDRAVSLLEKAKALEPGNYEWSEKLGQLYMLGMQVHRGEPRQQAASDALEQFEQALEGADAAHRRFLLPSAAKAALEAGSVEKADSYARELVVEAEQGGRSNAGNMIHHGHLVLGRLALAADDLDGARQHLLAAGETPGSPQLNSFGPNMTLAKELLEQGEAPVVLEYFQLCREFWQDQGQLDVWIAAVKAGETPNFGANLFY